MLLTKLVELGPNFDKEFPKKIRALASKHRFTALINKDFKSTTKRYFLRLYPSERKIPRLDIKTMSTTEIMKMVLPFVKSGLKHYDDGSYTDALRLISMFRHYGRDLPEFKSIEKSIGEAPELSTSIYKNIKNRVLKNYIQPEYLASLDTGAAKIHKDLFKWLLELDARVSIFGSRFEPASSLKDLSYKIFMREKNLYYTFEISKN